MATPGCCTSFAPKGIERLMSPRRRTPPVGKRALLAGVAAALLCSAAAHAQTPSKPPVDGLEKDEMYMEADEVLRDDDKGVTTANGNIEVRYNGRTLRADKLVYDDKTGVIRGYGHIVIVGEDGSTEFADEVILDDEMKAGVALGFSARLQNNVKIAAASAAKRNENYNRSYAVGREVSVTRQQSGQVKRLSVAVALKNPEGGKPRSAQELAALEALVKGAVGFDAGRGDVVALTARSFAAAEVPAESWWQAGWVSMLARNLTALAVAALLVFGLAKPLMKRGGAALAKRAETKAVGRNKVSGEIADAFAEQVQINPDARVTLEMIEAARSYEARAALIKNFVRQDPARAALVVRDLIRSDAKDGDNRHG